MRALARESGSGGHRFIVLPAGAQTNFAMGELIRFGVVSDVVTAGGDSMRMNGTPWGGDFLDGRDAKVMKVGEDESPYRLPRVQTDTAAFRRWFGNSQAIDEDGQPLVMYHGTNKDITAFQAGSCVPWRASRAVAAIASSCCRLVLKRISRWAS